MAVLRHRREKPFLREIAEGIGAELMAPEARVEVVMPAVKQRAGAREPSAPTIDVPEQVLETSPPPSTAPRLDRSSPGSSQDFSALFRDQFG